MRVKRLGPLTISYPEGSKGTAKWDFEFGLLLFATTLMVVFGHESAYRLLPADEKDYPLLGLISHFGADMLIVGGVVAMMAVVLLHWREKRESRK